MHYDLNFNINHSDYCEVRLEILTQSNNWHNLNYWKAISGFKEAAPFKKVLSERLLTDVTFHQDLVRNSPNGQLACTLVHSKDLTLLNTPLSSSAKASLTQYARLSP